MFKGYWPTTHELATLRQMGQDGGRLTDELLNAALEKDTQALRERHAIRDRALAA